MGRSHPAPHPHLHILLCLAQVLCYCDKLWAGSDDILRTKCMYPGSQDHPFLPFRCPMDHYLSPHEWQRAGVAYRDAAFLASPRRQVHHYPAATFELPLADASARLLSPTAPVRLAQAIAGTSSISDVAVVSRTEYEALPAATQRRALPHGVDAHKATR